MLSQIRALHLAFWVMLLGYVPVEATVVVFDVANVFGNTYEYSYTVENDSLGSELEELAVYFEVGLFENLRMPAAPAGWDPIVIQPDVLLSDPGFYDALALGSGVPVGGSLGGFAVWADFLGVGAPGSQRFEILDPATLGVLDSGDTVRTAGSVPEPASVFIIGIGLLAAGVVSRERRQH